MRLIDADEAEKQFTTQYCESCNSYDGLKCRACEARDGADVYADMPTIDPVKHGRWILYDEYPYNNCYCCSCCGDKFILFDGTPFDNNYNYCPNCGVKMDERRKQ